MEAALSRLNSEVIVAVAVAVDAVAVDAVAAAAAAAAAVSRDETVLAMTKDQCLRWRIWTCFQSERQIQDPEDLVHSHTAAPGLVFEAHSWVTALTAVMVMGEASVETEHLLGEEEEEDRSGLKQKNQYGANEDK
jgi:hypothetical protein